MPTGVLDRTISPRPHSLPQIKTLCQTFPMRKLTVTLYLTVAVLLGSVGEVWSAEDQPRSGIVYATGETGYISYECKSLPTGQITCEFFATRVRKDQADRDAIKEAKIEWDRNKSSVTNGILKNCEWWKKLVPILEGNVRKSKQIKKVLKSQTDTSKNDLLKMGKAFVGFCRDKSLENYLKIIRLVNGKKNRTCIAGSQTWKTTFNRAGRTTWSAVTTPEGTCGIVRLDRFEREIAGGRAKIPFWNFISKKAVTNPKGKGLYGQSCNWFDENEYKWSWRTREVPMDCDYIVPRPN